MNTTFCSKIAYSITFVCDSGISYHTIPPKKTFSLVLIPYYFCLTSCHLLSSAPPLQLPVDFQERVSTHIEKHGRSGGVTMAMCHSPYSDAVPTAIIAKVLEKPEPGSSCPATRSPSPAPQDGDFLSNNMGTGSTDQLNRRTAYKTSDLYSRLVGLVAFYVHASVCMLLWLKAAKLSK